MELVTIAKMLKWLFTYTFYEETEHYSETNANEIYKLYLKDNYM